MRILHHMRQFVGQQAASFGCGRSELAGSKGDVGAHGVSESVNGTCRLGGAGVGVDADIAEVVSEAGLEEGLGFRIECLARRAKGFAYDRWNLLRSRRRGDGAMEAGTGAVLDRKSVV